MLSPCVPDQKSVWYEISSLSGSAKVSSIVYTSIFRSISIVPQRVSTAVYTFWRCSGFPYQVVFRPVKLLSVWREAASSCNFITVSKIVYTSIPHVISISPQGCKGLFTPPLFLTLFHKCLYIKTLIISEKP